MVDEVTLAISIGAIVISVASAIPLYLDYFERRAQKRADFEIERFREPSRGINAWSIRILHPNKAIEHCTVIVRERDSDFQIPLSVSDEPEYVHETKIPIGGAANFQVPKSILNPFSYEVIVRDKDKVLLTRRFGEIPETSA